MPGRNIHTVYDMMDAKGVFRANPANRDSRSDDGQALYTGPQLYPRMLYHPEGKTRVLNPGMMELVAGQYQLLGRLEEIEWMMVRSAKEEDEWRKKGWHVHPAHAVHAGGGEAPPISAESRIADLEAQIAAMKAQIDEEIDLSKPLVRKAAAPVNPLAKAS